MTARVTKVRAGSVPDDVWVLRACGKASQEKIGKCREGVEYFIRTHRNRIGRHHRLVFAMLRGMFDNQEDYTSKDVYRAAVKLAIGWVYDEPVMDEHGALHWQVKPLDYFNCDQDDFEKFHELLLPYVIQHFGEDFLARYETD